MNEQTYKLCFYVPESHVELVKRAVFAAEAGHIGNYDSCAFQVRGEGQFRPLDGSQPFLGQQGEVEKVAEYRVETIVTAANLQAAISALRLAHPYEEPAIDLWKLEPLPA
ncbi:YqfO family protein [Alcanivorax sp. DP30]|uniref:Nif3-like dinuclear metal center hexameric protein n=1 Tax=Alcanivorax sp. DP30 TaxID=2606217 RepID=UPI00136FD6D5|nr:YqfO family protein [Alcanivorax sp. DP30]MZR63936.1 NGG1p interacting factor NIF3 [Alcanivorax sp. DP30]